MKYTYWVSYAYGDALNRTACGFGSAEVIRVGEIRHAQEVMEISRWIQDSTGHSNVIILTWNLLNIISYANDGDNV